MPRYFAGRAMQVGDQLCQPGDEIPEAGDWSNLSVWAEQGHVVVSFEPAELQEALRALGGTPNWMRAQSIETIRGLERGRYHEIFEAAAEEPIEPEVEFPGEHAQEEALEALAAKDAAEAAEAEAAAEAAEAAEAEGVEPFSISSLKASEAIEWAESGDRTEGELLAAHAEETDGKGRVTVIEAIEARLTPDEG